MFEVAAALSKEVDETFASTAPDKQTHLQEKPAHRFRPFFYVPIETKRVARLI